jgi:lysophospholipase L1-like esterase
MNDVPYMPEDDGVRTRIFVLGDSHTYAIGVSMDQTWAKMLERKLNSTYQAEKFRVYNGGVTGFNMHQYLLRLIDQGPMLRPHYVVLGLSYATDLYDLLPPNHGGWIYGGERARDYFDFDSSGELTEIHWEPSAPSSGDNGHPIVSVQRVRLVLEHFATFRYLRRSKLALFLGSHIKIYGQTLWPNMEVIVEKDVSSQHEYQWRLFKTLLSRINQETERQHAKLIVVGIPYIAQVYDEIWQLSFGGDAKFSRTAAIERVRSYCQSHGIMYVDALDALHAKTKEVSHWLHYRHDAHPTAEGHEVIAETILRSGVLQPVY